MTKIIVQKGKTQIWVEYTKTPKSYHQPSLVQEKERGILFSKNVHIEKLYCDLILLRSMNQCHIIRQPKISF